MTSLTIFVLGLIVTSITGCGAILIGLEEAADPVHSNVDELTTIEKKIVGRTEES